VDYGWLVELEMTVRDRPHHVVIMVGSNYPFDEPRAFVATFKYRMGQEVNRYAVDFVDEAWDYHSTLLGFVGDVQHFMETY